MKKHSNDILKPSELISEPTKQEFTSDNDDIDESSTTPSENSQSYPRIIRRVVPWIEAQTFTDLELANEYVKDTTRETLQSLCVFIIKNQKVPNTK